MKIWFLILSLVDCVVCPTEKPSIHYSIEDAAMEMGRYKNIKQADLIEFDSMTRTIKKVPVTLDTEHRWPISKKQFKNFVDTVKTIRDRPSSFARFYPERYRGELDHL